MKKTYLILLFILFLWINSIAQKIQNWEINPNIEKLITNHKNYAVLPVTVKTDVGNSINKKNIFGKPKITQQLINENELFLTTYLQDIIYNELLIKQKQNNWSIAFQQSSVTNIILKESNINLSNISNYSAIELAKILKVDAVIISNLKLKKHFYFWRHVAEFFYLPPPFVIPFGFGTLFTKHFDYSLKIEYLSSKGDNLCKYEKENTGTFKSKMTFSKIPKKGCYRKLKKAIINIPYNFKPQSTPYNNQIVVQETLSLTNNENTENNEKVKPNIKIQSDVDINIPESEIKQTNVYGLIIGNEDYKSSQNDLNSEVNVDFAAKDAEIFKEYCIKTLGLPDKNIKLLINSTGSQIKQNLEWLSQLVQANNGNAELIFYYAGHGLPDEITKEPYLIPVDVSGSNLKYAIKLIDIYKTLTESNPKKVTVFLDACFSGGARNNSLLTLRGVKIKPKENLIGNNLVVFTSSSGDESSASYKEKQHGLFTYYLLKKIQETKGNITYYELFEYLKQEIKINSLLNNQKQQNPQIIGSPELDDKWKNWKIK